MIAADHDRTAELAGGDHFVDAQAESGALPEPQPADARRQPLLRDPIAGEADPAAEDVVVGEHLEHQVVQAVDVLAPAGERGPAEGPSPLAEQGAHVRRDEAGIDERAVLVADQKPALLGLAAQVVAVVERDGPPLLHPLDRIGVQDDRLEGPPLVLFGVRRSELAHRGELADGHVVQQIVRRGLVGDDIGNLIPPEELGQDLGAVPDEADRERLPGPDGLLRPAEGLVEALGHAVAVALADLARDALRVHLDVDDDAAVHRDRHRLGAAHTAEPAGDDEPAGERPAEARLGRGRERLERPLEDPLRADVDPAAGGHLPVHRQAHRVVVLEVLRSRPGRDDVAVGDQNPGAVPMRRQHADGLAGLDQERLVLAQFAKRRDDAIVLSPVPRRPPGASVDDELLGDERHLGREVVLEHPQRRLGLPRPAAPLVAQGGAHRLRGHLLHVHRSRGHWHCFHLQGFAINRVARSWPPPPRRWRPR